jgi:hypothetical protein
LAETPEGRELSEAEIQSFVADARDRIRGDPQNILVYLGAQQ